MLKHRHTHTKSGETSYKKIQVGNGHFQKVTSFLNKNLVKNKIQNRQKHKTAKEHEMLLQAGPWIGTFTADGMTQINCTRSLGDAGTDGGFACSCQPTESDCIFADVSVGGRSFYQERGRVQTGRLFQLEWLSVHKKRPAQQF